MRKRVLIAACIWGLSVQVNAQDRATLEPTTEIPRSYKSWSLFLVCNPAWIVHNADKGINELFRQYKAFGDAIGPNHLAVWFWKKPAEPATADNTDIGRSSAYCAKYKLKPSETPQVLVTTKYPDDKDPGDHVVVRLNGLDAHDSALAITKLAHQLVATGLNQSELDASDKWRRLLAAVSSAISATGCYFNKVSFSFKTGAVDAEIGHATNKDCSL